MPLSPRLTVRDRRPELMDAPDLGRDEHRSALAGLARTNRFSAASAQLWRPLRRRMRTEPGRDWRLLDVASGAGDVALGLARRAAEAGLSLSVTGVDVSDVAVEYARARAACAHLPAAFEQRDVLRDGLPAGFDFVTCSLFLHHLDAPDAVNLLRVIGRSAGTLGLISDLRRTRLGYLFAYCGTRLLTRSKIVHVDGPLSIRGAFTVDEARTLLRDAGLEERCRVIRLWPQRYLIAIEPPRVSR